MMIIIPCMPTKLQNDAAYPLNGDPEASFWLPLTLAMSAVATAIPSVLPSW